MDFLAGFAVTLAFSVLVTLAAARLTRRWWQDAPAVAICFGLLGLGLVAQLSWALCWWSGTAAEWLPWILLVGALVVLAAGPRRLSAVLFAGPVLAWVAGGSVLALFSILYGGTEAVNFQGAAQRYLSLPIDNYLQYLFAFDLRHGISTTMFTGDWNGSDRPPLQSGMILMSQGLASRWGQGSSVPIDAPGALGFGLGASVAAQTIWIPAVWAMTRTFGARTRVTVVVVLVALALPTSVVETAFTWPKMMSAGFLVASVTMICAFNLGRGPSVVPTFAVAAGLSLCGYLSHGGAAFLLPLLVGLGVLAVRRAGLRASARGVVVAGLGSALLYAPWWAYGHWADPATGRLLKYHFAGVQQVDPRSVVQAIRDQYSQMSLGQVLSVRRANVDQLFDPDLFWWRPGGMLTREALRSRDFFSTAGSLGLGLLALVLVVAVVVLRSGLCAVRRTRPVRATPEARQIGAVIVGCLVCMVVWSLTFFSVGNAIPHQGSYAWTLMLAVLPVMVLAMRSIAVGVFLAIAQWCYSAVVYWDPAGGSPYRRVDPPVAAALAGVVLVLAALAAVVLLSSWAPRRGGGGRRRRPLGSPGGT
ncbi:MAG: hypothetical protein QM572_02855 [Nocardioides sp.]|uniref:hypothetical protein n=1 Tax=Nocardioides sp. TaxID=35761 RepID=UPI0039E27691